MSGYDITALFLLVLLVVGYHFDRRACRREEARRAAMKRHPSTRSRMGRYDPHQRGEWR